MPDIVDMAHEIEAEHIARSLSRATRAIPAGVPGVCDECEEPRPRLVDGRCGYCRDGRTPPPSSFDDPLAQPEECLPVPNPAPSENRQQVSLPADGEVLFAIRRYSEEHDVGLGRAAYDMIAKLIAAPEPSPAPKAPSEWDGTRDGAVVFLENVPDRWLTEELIRRFETTVGADDHAAALQDRDAAVAHAEEAEARAIAAEGALSSLRDNLRGLVS